MATSLPNPSIERKANGSGMVAARLVSLSHSQACFGYERCANNRGKVIEIGERKDNLKQSKENKTQFSCTQRKLVPRLLLPHPPAAWASI